MRAQMRLANLLRDERLPFRPNFEGKPDGGAGEIRRLYTSAFASGSPVAGLEFARLYRSGFPKDRPSEVIPKDPETAVELLGTTMAEDQVDQLRADYGDRATLKYLNFESAVLLAKPDVPVTCQRTAFSKNIAFWSWKCSVPPTDTV
jgi:hypothetical protein